MTRNVDQYNLNAIIAVGFKVNNERAVQFRKWAKIHAETEWEKFRIIQDRLYQSVFDRFLLFIIGANVMMRWILLLTLTESCLQSK